MPLHSGRFVLSSMSQARATHHREEVIDEFTRRGYPSAGHMLTDPDGKYRFSDLPTLCRHSSQLKQELLDVGMPVADALTLMKDLGPGGYIFTALCIQGRLALREFEPPRNMPSSRASDDSALTNLVVHKIVKQPMQDIERQVYAHSKVVREYNYPFENLYEGMVYKWDSGDMDEEEWKKTAGTNKAGNRGKHDWSWLVNPFHECA